MKKVILATAVAMSLSSSAFAVTAQSGPYLNALGGWSFSSTPSASEIGAGGEQIRGFTLGANVGYDYAFNQNWMTGLELGYMSFGHSNYDNNPNNVPNFSIKSRGYQLMATGTYLMANGFNVFGKVGAINEISSQSNGVPVDANGDTSAHKWMPAAAIGVGYMPIQNVNIALQYEHVFGSQWDSNTYASTSRPNPLRQNAITLGLTYKFGM